MQNLFIVIEGLDGVGKSTVSEHLAKSIDAYLYRTPPEEYRAIRSSVDTSGNRYAQLTYYLSGVFYASSQIKKLLDEGRSVVCDRYYYTTLTTYADLLESTHVDFWKHIDLIENKFFQPHFAFLLTLEDKSIRQQRLFSRGKLSADDIESLNDDIVLRTLEAYRKFNLKEIETSQLTVNGVVEEIKRIIV